MTTLGLKDLIRADWERYGKNYETHGNLQFYLLCPGARITFWFRCYQYLSEKKHIILAFLSRLIYRSVSNSSCAYIPSGAKIEKGLMLAHPCGIVINSMAVIGVNCTMMSGVVIGQTEKGVPTIGNDVYMGAHAIVIGPVTVGNNVTIGAGAVVVKDIPDNSIVAGNPARCINYNIESE